MPRNSLYKKIASALPSSLNSNLAPFIGRCMRHEPNFKREGRSNEQPVRKMHTVIASVASSTTHSWLRKRDLETKLNATRNVPIRAASVYQLRWLQRVVTRWLIEHAEKDLGFLRIGSLNVRVKRTTEAFSQFLGVATSSSASSSNNEKIHKSWGSADNVQVEERKRDEIAFSKITRYTRPPLLNPL